MSKKCTRCGLDVEKEAISREELNECPRCGESLAVAAVRNRAEAAAAKANPKKKEAVRSEEEEPAASSEEKEKDTTEDMPPRGREPACDPPEGE